MSDRLGPLGAEQMTARQRAAAPVRKPAPARARLATPKAAVNDQWEEF